MVSVDIGLAELTLNLAQTNVKLTHTSPSVCILATRTKRQKGPKVYGLGVGFSGFGVGFGVGGGVAGLFADDVFEFDTAAVFAFEFEFEAAAEFELLFDFGPT